MANDKNLTFDLAQIKTPNKIDTLLFIDKILEAVPEKRATGLNVGPIMNGFSSHYEDEPNVPGFIQVESLVQTFIMTFLSFEEHKGNKTNFVSMDKVKFKKKSCQKRCNVNRSNIRFLQKRNRKRFCKRNGGW